VRNYNRASIAVAVLAMGSLPLLMGQACPFGGPDTQNPSSVQNITPLDAQTLIQSHTDDPDFIILDVRTPAEFTAGHIEGGLNACVNCQNPAFDDVLAAFDKNKTYLVYCGVGGRSATATGIMIDSGFTNVYNMTGGITQWLADGLPVVQ
jgi:rhodanese-related sulfurtransferase